MKKNVYVVKGPSREDVRNLFEDVSNGLVVLHSYGIFQSFLSPHQVNYTPQLRWKLSETYFLDYLMNFTTHVDDITLFCQPPYMAPELYAVLGSDLRSKKRSSFIDLYGREMLRKSDAWSLGMLVGAFMLSGSQDGFPHTESSECYEWSTTLFPLLLHSVRGVYGNDLVDVVLKLINPTPSKRCTIEEAMKALRIREPNELKAKVVPKHYLHCLESVDNLQQRYQYDITDSSSDTIESLYSNLERNFDSMVYNDPTFAFGFKSATKPNPAAVRSLFECLGRPILQDPVCFYLPPLSGDDPTVTRRFDIDTYGTIDAPHLKQLIETTGFGVPNVTPTHAQSTTSSTPKRSGKHNETMKHTCLDFIQLQDQATKFRHLLLGYPQTRNQIIHECLTHGVFPLFRGELWAAILGVAPFGILEAQYKSYISANTSRTSMCERQIQLDIPRCHQYHPMLGSAEGHRKLFDVLRSWVLHEKGKLTYWQGLDSMAATLLQHSAHNEWIAFGSLVAIVNLFVPNLFNHDEMAKCTLLYNKLLGYHDPELRTHLEDVEYRPELYVLPWFLTLFSHVLPLSTVNHMWDAMLLGPVNFIIMLAVSVVHQNRDRFLRMDFNQIILQFGEMLENIDVTQVVADAKTMSHRTPASILNPAGMIPPNMVTGCQYPLLAHDDFINDVCVNPAQYRNCFMDEFSRKQSISGANAGPVALDVGPSVLALTKLGQIDVLSLPRDAEWSPSEFANHLEECLATAGVVKGRTLVIVNNEEASSAAQALLQRGWPYVSIVLNK
eukprot:PhF_6_TR41673/c1_g1_i1/m.63186/K17544/TBCK; TBC domain-containing protein kinase-like protein